MAVSNISKEGFETCFVWDLSSTFQHRTWASRFGSFSLFRTLWHPLIPWSLYVNAVNAGDLRCAAEVQLTGEASQQQQKLCSRFTVRLPSAGRTLIRLPHFLPFLRPRHDVRCHRDGRVGAQLPADTPEAGRTGVRLLGALPGCGSRDEPGMGDCWRPVLPVPVGVLLEAGEHGELAVQQHSGIR